MKNFKLTESWIKGDENQKEILAKFAKLEGNVEKDFEIKGKRILSEKFKTLFFCDEINRTARQK